MDLEKLRAALAHRYRSSSETGRCLARFRGCLQGLAAKCSCPHRPESSVSEAAEGPKPPRLEAARAARSFRAAQGRSVAQFIGAAANHLVAGRERAANLDQIPIGCALFHVH